MPYAYSVAIAPVGFDGVDIEFLMMSPRAVDDPIHEAAPEPGGERRRVPKLVLPAPCADDRFLGTILGLVRVVHQPGRESNEVRELTHELRSEPVTGGRRLDLLPTSSRCTFTSSGSGAAQPAAGFVLTRAASFGGSK